MWWVAVGVFWSSVGTSRLEYRHTPRWFRCSVMHTGGDLHRVKVETHHKAGSVREAQAYPLAAARGCRERIRRLIEKRVIVGGGGKDDG